MCAKVNFSWKKFMSILIGKTNMIDLK